MRGNIEAIYPLTPVQEGILFHTLYAPESPLYIQQYTTVLEGDLDVGILRGSWDHVIGRHQTLRSLLAWEGREQPLQIVRGRVQPEWLIEDWRAEPDTAERLQAFLEADRNRGFDLAVAPLMRFAVFHIGDGRHQFVWSHHHIVVDGWSMGIVLDEVVRTYAALRADAEPALPPAADYRRYVEWLQSHDGSGAEAHWRSKLRGFDVATPLRIEKTSLPTPWAEHHAEEIVRISATQTAAISEAARRNGLTLNTLLRGAWSLILGRYSGRDDVVFGATAAGRPLAVDGAMDLVGMFINTLPVRVQIDPGTLLIDWLHAIQDEQIEGASYETTPLADVQGWSDVPSGQPLFTSLLVFENVPVPSNEPSGLRSTEVRYLQRSNYPLALLVMPLEELELIFLYDADRFDRDVIRRMAQQLEHVLVEMVDHMDGTIESIEVMPDAERDEILVAWNDTAASYPDDQTMHDLIVAAAATAPDRLAVTDGTTEFTYAELVSGANTIANTLQSLGVGPGACVAIAMPRSPAMVAAILGVMCAGAAYVPLDPAQPAARRDYVLADTAAAAIIVADGATVEPSPALPIVVLDRRAAIVTAPPAEAAARAMPAARPEDLAYVLFTSGSTGRPKGVAVTHQNLVASTHVRRTVYPGRVGAFLLVSPFIFDSSLVGLFWTLYDAGTIVLPAPRMEQDVRHLASLIEGHHVTHTLALPAVYDLLLEHAAPGQLESLEVMMVAGEACPPALAERHHAKQAATLLVNEYGPTEATVWCTAHTVTAADAKRRHGELPARIPIGRPIPNARVYVLDAAMRPVPVGVPGELCVAGAGLTAGYLGHPELTEQQFVTIDVPEVGEERIYRTGDMARFRPDGTLDLLGRLDHQVKVRGQRIELSEIEMVLQDHPGVRAVAAVVRTDASAPILVAYAESTVAGDDLRRHLAERLPEVMVPSVVVTLDTMPKGATGKIDRNRLPAPDLSTAVPGSGPAAPMTDAEETLAAIWAEVLGLPSVAATDDFFELGGDSILSIRIIARAHEAGFSITPRQFFETPTVAELAAALG